MNKDITKEQFIKLLTDFKKTIKEMDDACNSMRLSGEWIGNRWLERAYESLELALGLADEDHNDKSYGYETDLDYFVWTLDFGDKFKLGCYQIDGVDVDLSSIEAFYEFCAFPEKYYNISED